MTLDLDIPWTEKYRPVTWNDIVSQNIAINNLKDFVKSGNMPHMIFTGPAGTGKTSTALIIAKKLLKEENYCRDLLELNASDTVRMSYVRKVLKAFVNQNMNPGEKNLKIVILDEADNIPNPVQQALRRIIEKTSSSVKFILMCNYINRIIDPIISRCAVFRFVNLSKEKIKERLKYIAQREKLHISEDKAEKFFDTLFFISGGDLRKAINTLQMAVALELSGNIETNEIFKISGFLDELTLEKLIDALQAKDFTRVRNIVNLFKSIDSRNFIRQISSVLPRIKSIKSKNLPMLRAYMGDIDFRISQGADEQIQILALVAEIIDNVNKL
ncbi:MAG: AAA family ATPase [Promethearchaeota archaeon]